MSTFKHRTKKVHIKDNRITLDARHNNYIKDIKKNKKNLPNLKEKYDKFNLEFKNLNSILKKDMTNDEFNRYNELKNLISELKEEIENIEDNKELKEYFLNTGHILYKYYDNINKASKTYNDLNKISINNKENKKDNNVKNKEDEIENDNNINSKCKNVIDFFNPTAKKNKKTRKVSKISDYVSSKKFTRANLLNSYMKIIDKDYLDKKQISIDHGKCTKCNKELILQQSEGCMICETCGKIVYILIDSDKPSYKDPPPEISYFAYKRINHFNEWLAQFQAKESTDIPQEVFDKIVIEIKKERRDNMATLTNSKIRQYLKKLRLNKYYEHVPHIINRLNGLPPPVMSPKVEARLRLMFKEIQEPFMKVCPKNRKNFLSYSYVLHKFVELLELDQYKSCFPLLKSREKLHQQDKIWKDICKILKWEYIRSI
jgi:hypothetical protein